MSFYFGLNVDYDLSELVDKRKSLKSLGLDLDDLDVIRGASNAGVTKDDLITLSGIDFDTKRRMFGIDAVLNNYERLFQSYPTNLDDAYTANININNKFITKGLKYDYFDYDLKRTVTADVSTSRISSWSSFNDANAYAPIFYGGDVEVRPNSSTGKSKIKANRIKTTKEPIALKYASEVATDVMKININGEIKDVFVMKGIPLKLSASMSRIQADDLNHVVELNTEENDPSPVWTIRNIDNGALYEYTDLKATDGIDFQDFVFREREIEFYYTPRKILQLTAKRLGLKAFPKSNLANLNFLDLSTNDLREFPDLSFISPNELTYVNLSSNDINRSSLTIQAQLNRFSTSLETIIIDDTIKEDDSNIGYYDLSHLTNLKKLSFAGGFDRLVEDGLFTPRVNTATIEEYDVKNHGFLRIDSSLFTAPNLKVIDVSGNEMNYHEPTFSSTVIESYNANINNFKIVDLSNRLSLQSYEHSGVFFEVPGINGAPSWLDIETRNPIAGCTSLKLFDMTETNVTGTISNILQNLPALETISLASTQLTGPLINNTFFGTSLVKTIALGGNAIGSEATDFFGTTVFDSLLKLESVSLVGDLTSTEYENIAREMETLYTTNPKKSLVKSPRINGRFPNLTNNIELKTLNITNSEINGTLPTFEENINISTIVLSSNKISGYLPSLDLNNLNVLYLNDNEIVSDSNNLWPVWRLPQVGIIDVAENQLSGSVPTFINCPNLETLDISYNELSEYYTGTLHRNYSLKTLNMSNNSFGQTSCESILDDLLNNYQASNRTRVTVDLSGNNFTLQDVLNDPVKANAYNILTKVARWSIII